MLNEVSHKMFKISTVSWHKYLH